MNKPKTIFCDIDGTIFKYRQFKTYTTTPAELLPGVFIHLTDWKSQGHCIVLTSARPEYLREHTIKELQSNGIPWDQLVLGIGRGARFLINDRDVDNIDDRAIGVNLKRNQGFDSIDWNAKGL